MKHLEYKDTTNKAFKTYYDKFKKMVKQDLSGDGWFLLVKDFPFKDGDNLMFTAGEDIGKWQDKNLVSLYGKTKYIVGRCRKKGPVLSLLDFQEGDYVKEATEAGLRKELKEFFKGTGVSVRTFKSLKVNEPEPDVSEEDAPEPEVTEAEIPGNEPGGLAFEPLEMPKLTPTAIKAMLEKAIDTAKALGVLEEQEFVDRVNDFKKAVPRMAVMKGALARLNEYLGSIEPPTPGSEDPSPATETESDAALREELDQLELSIKKQRDEVLKRLTQLQESLNKGETERLEENVGLIEESEKILEKLIGNQLTRKEQLEAQLAG